MNKYFIEIKALLDKGVKFSRLSWPAGQYLVKMKGLALTASLTKAGCEFLGLPEGSKPAFAEDCYILVQVTPATKEKEAETKAIIGYTLTHEDKSTQEWLEFKEEQTA